MSEAPKIPAIVRERLRAQQADGGDSDAHLLSAFAEDSLTKPEREQLMQHLAACPDCRAVLAVMQPDEGPVPVRALRARKLSVRWQAMRWAAMAAAAAVLVAVVVLYKVEPVPPQEQA